MNKANPESDSPQAAISHLYDELQKGGFYDEKFGGNETHSGRLVVHAVPKTADSVLEVGPATGLQLKQILDARQRVREVTALESAPEMAARLATRIEPILSARSGHLRVIVKPVQEAWNEIEPHDVVISSYVGAYLGDIPVYIDKLYQLVNPGGVLIYVDAVEPAPPLSGTRFIVQSLAMLFWSYLKEGLVLSPADLMRSAAFAQVEANPHYLALSQFHASYQFPIQAWHEAARKYRGRVLHTAPISAILVCQKGPKVTDKRGT